MTSDLEAQLKVLMLRGLDGDAAAHHALLGAMGQRLRAYFARRLGDGQAEVEDLVQEVLIAIHRRRDTFDRNQPFTAWAWALARYKLIDHYRRTRRRAEAPLEDYEDVLFGPGLEAEEARRDLDALLADLPDKQSDLIRMTRIEGLSMAEAAVRAGMSETAVKVSVHRALKRLGLEVQP